MLTVAIQRSSNAVKVKTLILGILLMVCQFSHPVFSYDIEVLAFGDSGSCDSPNNPASCIQNTIANAMKSVCDTDGCDMGILLGDNFYEAGITSDGEADPQFQYKYEVHYNPLAMPIYAALGNHDIGNNSNLTKQQIQQKIDAQIGHTDTSPTWRMLAEYYDYVQGGVHFFVINSNDFDREQREWLQNGLKNSTENWKVVYGHHPIRSNGVHGDTSELVVELLPLICAYADLYVAGHDHDLQLLESDCGVPFVISGAAGKIRSTNTSSNAPRRRWSISSYGFSRILFNSNDFNVRYYNENGTHLYSRNYTRLTTRTAPSLYTGSLRIVNKVNADCVHASGWTPVGLGWDIYRKACVEQPWAGSSSDRYYLKADATHSGAYILENKEYGTCVHTSRSHMAGWTYNVYHQQCSIGSSGDYFELVYNGDGYWKVRNKDYGTCIHGSSSQLINGNITFYDRGCYSTDKQLFFFEL